MKENYARYIEGLDRPLAREAKKVAMLYECDLNDTDYEIIKEIVMSYKPRSYRAVATACRIIMGYAGFLGRSEIVQMMIELDKAELWEEIRHYSNQKYISFSDYSQMLDRIKVEEQNNSLIKTCVFRCVYEGIYNSKFESLINMRGSDINGNIVTVHNGKEDYPFEISQDLAEDLIELSRKHTFTMSNRFGGFESPAYGKDFDSCFKFVIKRGNKDISSVYYQLLLALRKKYLDFNLSPYDLFISGIMHRVSLKMKDQGIDIEKVFEAHNHEPLGEQIVLDELKRCHYDIEFTRFRVNVIGHLDKFK